LNSLHFLLILERSKNIGGSVYLLHGGCLIVQQTRYIKKERIRIQLYIL